MIIAGLQKLTLLDYPGQVACTVFTGGCNFRCPFCHNAALVLPELSEGGEGVGAALDFLRKRRGILDAVVVSGGEPLMQRGLEDFLKSVRSLGYRIKLDTNGSFPERLRALAEEGLVDRVAMDIKNSPALYAQTVGVELADISAIERSKSFLLGGGVDCEFRTTVVKGLHTRESLMEAARWIEGAKEYYLQQFRNSGQLIDASGLEPFPDDEMRSLLADVRTVIPSAALRGIE